jgi:branched-chain amino acid transport system substrate-binding protein
MAKLALLIGVSEYEHDLTPLPGAAKDVEAMQRVLQHPEIGDFARVIALTNPAPQAMREAIETLFSGRTKDDLVLLYFSGHGIKDESGQLYFATRITRKNEYGELVKSTAVAASVVRDFMDNSRSKQQVMILDCCFSGAFAQGLSVKGDGFVDVRKQLGGEGRAVLTSSTSTQYSFDSIYTHYLVDGLETGAADLDNDGEVSVEELHEYTKQNVQQAAPAMKPEIYPFKEGYKILLARARNEPQLRYRKTVERLCASSEISNTGRRILTALRESLRLSLEETKAIETEVLEPYERRKNNLQEYEQAFIEAIQRGYPISDKTHDELKDLQKVLGLRDEDIAPIESRLMPTPDESPISRKFTPLMGLLFIAFSSFVGGIFFNRFIPPILPTTPELEISLGEKILLKRDTNPDKQAGVKAFASGDFQTAFTKFQSSLKVNRNDPEAWIYLNNAQAANTPTLKIAVSVPIDNNPDVAKEILRGVAQAQKEVNEKGGIKGELLQVKIGNDNNSPELARIIATEFVKDFSILAVVGHNSSEASLGAAPEYEKGGLVMITPTSDARTVSELKPPTFRTMPYIRVVAEELANYAVKTANLSKIAICADSQAKASQSLKEEFKNAIHNAGGASVNIDCDLSATSFNPSKILSEFSNKGAKGILLLPAVNTIDNAIEVAKANRGRLSLLGSPTMNSHQTLNQGRCDVNGLVVAVPWNPAAGRGKSFTEKAKNLWGGNVNWRSAMAYDASQAIIKGLEKDKTRLGLSNTLASSSESFPVGDGATGKIYFQGDRKTEPALLKVQPQNNTEKGYDFVPLPAPDVK